MGISAFDREFWKADDPGKAAVTLARRIQFDQRHRYDRYVRNACLYGDEALQGLDPDAYDRVDNEAPRLSINVVKNVCDAYQSEMTQSVPKTTFLTEGGMWEQKERAEGLGFFCEGAFEQTDFYSHWRQNVLDSAIHGTGLLHIDDAPFGLYVNRLYCWEHLVDSASAYKGNPRIHFIRYFEDRERLIERFPKAKATIAATEPATSDDRWSYWVTRAASDLVLVTESWVLPTAQGRGNGVHIVGVDAGTIGKRKYEAPFPPIVPIRRAKAPMGFYGLGIAQNLEGLQVEINEILLDIQEYMHRIAKPKWFVNKEAKVIKTQLDNAIGTIVEWGPKGSPPEIRVPQGMPPDVFRHLWELYAKAFEIEGISQLAAQAQKPAGIEAAAALRELSMAQSKRNVVALKESEDYCIQASKLYIEAAKRIARNGNSGLMVRSARKTYFKVSKWANVEMNDDQYMVRAYPSNALKGTPAEKVNQVYDWVKLQLLNGPDGKPDATLIRQLLDFPDFGSQLLDAPYESAMATVAEMLETGAYIPPHPNMDLNRAKTYAQAKWCDGYANKMPLEKLLLIDRFIDECISLIELTKPQETPAEMGIGNELGI